MAIIFDGRDYARKVTEELKENLAESGRKLKLVTLLDPNDVGSVVYTNLKAKKAGELGVIFEENRIQDTENRVDELKDLIVGLNKDQGVDGIMIQLPFGGERERELINLIDPTKDVDGLREDSPYVPATVRAVLEILKISILNFQFEMNEKNKKQILKTVVVGANGEVGSGIMKQFSIFNFQFSNKKLEVVGMGRRDFDPGKIENADVVISCTGQVGLIQPEMVKSGVIAIDVGYPGGDIAPEVAEKAAFFTPVPGGVGPVTVVMLFRNLTSDII